MARHHTIATVTAHKGKKSKSNIHHVTVRPVSNGFLTEVHHNAPEGKEQYSMQPDEFQSGSPEEMHAHIGDLFGAKSPAPPAKPADNEEDEENQEEE